MKSEMEAYLSGLTTAKIILWNYLIWYLVFIGFYFQADTALWVNAAGIAAVVGTALVLSAGGFAHADRWQLFRLYFTPFAVSSFSSLIKGQDFVVVFSPNLWENITAIVSCGLFLCFVLWRKNKANVAVF